MAIYLPPDHAASSQLSLQKEYSEKVGRYYICKGGGGVYTIFEGGNFTSFGQVAQEKVGCGDVMECLGSLLYHGNRVKGCVEEVINRWLQVGVRAVVGVNSNCLAKCL